MVVLDDKGIIFRTDDGSGGVTTYLKIDGDSSIIQTKVNNRFDDSNGLLMGGGSDLHMYHDMHSYLYNYTGDTLALKIDASDAGTEYLMTKILKWLILYNLCWVRIDMSGGL